MALARDRCICLRKLDYSETSQILLLFGRGHGLLRVIAKGAHRRTKAGASKFDGGLDLLDVGDADFTFDPAKELNLLTEWGLREGHLELRRSLRAMYLAQYAAELIALLFQEHDAHPALFDRLAQTLPELATPRAEETFLAFQLDLLRESGYLPELGHCGECGLPAGEGDTAWFSADRGGVVCRNCEGAVPVLFSLDARLLLLMQTVVQPPRAWFLRV
jgi:DNA repair protein RecO (recombination protein O)